MFSPYIIILEIDFQLICYFEQNLFYMIIDMISQWSIQCKSSRKGPQPQARWARQTTRVTAGNVRERVYLNLNHT